MKLKLVVASMSVLGLVSCPVFAATSAKHKHHRVHHHKMKHHMVAAEAPAPAPANYKGEVPVQPAPVEACSISQASMIMDATTQSIGRAMPNPCNPGWFNRLQFSGGINVDLGKWGDRNTGYMGENYQRLSLNDAYLNVGATINDWSKAFVSLSYGDPTTLPSDTDAGEYSAAYANNIQGSASNIIQLEQAYVTLGNFDIGLTPVYIQVGKQFQDFGRYEIHPITRSMTQVMSETLATSAKVGFIAPMGFHGSIAVFDDPTAKVGKSKKPTNYIASLGFDQPSDQLGWGVGVGYIYNLIGVNDVAYSVQNFTDSNGYNHRTSGLAVYGDVNSGPFTFNARYTAALQRFKAFDLPLNGQADVDQITDVVFDDARGAKPWAFGLQAGYGFEAFGCRTNNVYVGYQQSHEASGLDLPKHRWLAGYNVDVWKNTNFGIEWDHDKAYSVNHGGHGGKSDLVSLRGAVQFG